MSKTAPVVSARKHRRTGAPATAERRHHEETLAPDAAEIPPETALAIRRLLAEALVRDYLAESKRDSTNHGESPLGDALPTKEPGQ